MIPRLQPRSSLKRPSGVENMYPADTTHHAKATFPSLSSDTSTPLVKSLSGGSTTAQTPLSNPNDKRIFPLENAEPKELNEQPLSPSRPLVKYTVETSSIVLDNCDHCHDGLSPYYASTSSKCNSSETDDSSKSHIDYPLTPPTAGSRPPLLVSAKRHGSEVRRQHSKRRRIRRRPSGTRRESEKHSFDSGKSDNTTGSFSGKEKDIDTLCLWKVDSPEETDNACLPSLDSSDEEEEETNRIEDVVRAEHRKEAMDAQNSERLQRLNGSFSANRAPPPKGCLSNPRPKRPRGETTRYKTPPKSIDGEEPSFSESNINQARRVQFGIPSAVEYEIDRPPGHLTPMSQEVTRKRYSMDPKKRSREDEEITQETKQNNLILSEWEDQFSTTVEDKVRRSHRKRRRESSSKKLSRRNRRSSSIFSPSSRISMEEGHSTLSNPETKKHERTQPFAASQPKSASRRTNLASANILSSNKTFSTTSSNSSPQATPITTTGRLHEARAWNVVADLGTINSKGAMELSPNPATSNTKKSLCLVNKNSVSRVGATTIELRKGNQPQLDDCFDTPNPSDPIDKDIHGHRHEFRKDFTGSNSSLSELEGARDESASLLSRKLIASPWSDREWEFLTLLRNLSSKRKGENKIERYFKVLDSCIKDALFFDVDLVESIFPMASFESSPPTKLPKMNNGNVANEKRAQSIEWEKVEIAHMKNLTMILDQFRSKVKESMHHANSIATIFRSEEREVEKEISKLENEIHRLNSLFDLLEASKAPSCSISCQAAAQIGMYGFCFQKFHDEHTLELEYMHAVFDVKTRVIVDISSLPKVSIDYVDNASNREQQDPILDFHRRYINMLKVGNIAFDLNCAEVQDSLLRLGQILGKVDQCALAFNAINDGREAVVTFNLPHIRFAFPEKDATASLMLDLTYFQVKMMSVSIGGTAFSIDSAEILSSVDCCDLKSISNLIFKSSAKGCVK